MPKVTNKNKQRLHIQIHSKEKLLCIYADITRKTSEKKQYNKMTNYFSLLHSLKVS